MNIQLIILFLLVFAYQLFPNNDVGKKKYIILSCALFCIQSGFRHITVGVDTFGYYEGFWDVVNSGWGSVIDPFYIDVSEVRDPGYNLIVKCFSSVFPSWQLYLIIVALFFFVGLGRLWNRYLKSKKDVLFASLLWLALFNIIALSGIRQMITTALAFYITPCLEKKNWKIVLPIVILGSFIHVSFLLWAALIPLSYLKSGQSKFLLFVAIALVPLIGTMSQTIMTIMASQMENEYYQHYAEKTDGAVGYTYVFICTILSLFILIYSKLLKSAPKFYLHAAVLMTLFVPLILRGGTAIRMGQYFTIYMMFSLPYIVERLGKKENFYYSVMVSVLVIYVFITSDSTYSFFWNALSSYYLGL